MYSVNVPVPGRVRALAADFEPALTGFAQVRRDHTLVCKRLGSLAPHEVPAVNEHTRAALAGLPPFEAAVTDVDAFLEPIAGSAPVVYLAVESPGLREAHDRLVEEFGAAPDLEGDDYVPHVTIARDGDHGTATRLADREIEPVRWTVGELAFWDGRRDGRAGTVDLPA